MMVLAAAILAEVALFLTGGFLRRSFRHSNGSYTGRSMGTIAGKRPSRKYHSESARALYHNTLKVNQTIATDGSKLYDALSGYGGKIKR